jgi:HPt (histidine-containing phosphotransfer) domain-containing protein
MHLLDMDKLLAAFEGDRELIADLAEIFMDDLPGQCSAIETAMSEGNADGLRAAAHALKGASSNFRVESVTSKALELEMIGRSGTTEGAGPVFQELKRRLALLQDDLSELMKSS